MVSCHHFLTKTLLQPLSKHALFSHFCLCPDTVCMDGLQSTTSAHRHWPLLRFWLQCLFLHDAALDSFLQKLTLRPGFEDRGLLGRGFQQVGVEEERVRQERGKPTKSMFWGACMVNNRMAGGGGSVHAKSWSAYPPPSIGDCWRWLLGTWTRRSFGPGLWMDWEKCLRWKVQVHAGGHCQRAQKLGAKGMWTGGCVAFWPVGHDLGHYTIMAFGLYQSCLML